MESRSKTTATTAILLTMLLLSACATAPELTAKGASAPAGVDFSGLWLLRTRGESADGSWPDRGAQTPIGERPRRTKTRRSSRNSSSAHLFLETGRSLKVTQTDYSFFVSLDRSVVEEFTFGEKRIITLGEVRAQRVSGWEGAVYVVETLDSEGVILRDEWHLDESGDVLLRDVTLARGDEVRFSLNQAFDRQ